eukprot:CAMPEP_0172609084 /NCGR_PEP_ID=MMETSP1068-20121228/29119_1 /TAXON_ID=35684 /ORGANISM="Pseudopedinella elastica, Strain CCMP716" /LENGTH=277 /DNA_ID=CAMNT_0013412525 /DNA_START=121 /DNA_END=954 /DNA_ORIENTATION=+
MGKWRKGSCLVLSKKIVQREKTTDDTDGVYLVTHRVNITLEGEDGAEVIEGVRAWKAPAWALGPKELDHGNVSDAAFHGAILFYNGSACASRRSSHFWQKRWRTWDSKEQAKTYAKKYKTGKTYGCFYNKHDHNEVAFQCRDKTMRNAFIAGIWLLSIGLLPAALYFLWALFVLRTSLLDAVEQRCRQVHNAERRANEVTAGVPRDTGHASHDIRDFHSLGSPVDEEMASSAEVLPSNVVHDATPNHGISPPVVARVVSSSSKGPSDNRTVISAVVL